MSTEERRVPDTTVEVRDVSRWYGNVVAVNGISFSIGPGVTGLLGPNGAGKTTLLNMMAGFLKPSAGEVRTLGKASFQTPGIYEQVALVPEREAVYEFLTGYQFVLLSAQMHDLPDPETATRQALQMVEMEDAADRTTGGYSKGMKQRIKIAAALVHGPEVLLLDEPFNGMDPRQRLKMMSLLSHMAEEGRTILFSSHILEEVAGLSDNVLVVVAGRLAASGDYRAIRKLMTNRPHTFTIRSSNNRELAKTLLAQETIFSIELTDQKLLVRTKNLAAFALTAPLAAKEAGASLFEVRSEDESLESVFEYLVTS
ncbi:MAG: ABC transporter [Dehalococcoidia bacterium]|nr:ABC transporter [Dehalococcoidia bacterium]HCV00942.1 ABC transporter [Dehalococcoidia bacterium]|tara:strand:- start:703 stop:1641 length:939 start_codon:yes stop_codon:yes gene_type:complete